MNDDRHPILLVEDDTHIRNFVGASLRADGWAVEESSNAAGARAMLTETKPCLGIFDLGLPDGNGVTLIRELRQWSHLPVLVLSARSAEAEKVQALDAGADDYLTKPFGVQELLARVRALLRRSAQEEPEALVSFGDITVDRVHRTVRRAGVEVTLTPIEYRLLGVLLANVDRVLTHRLLLREVWGPGHAEREHYLRIYVGHLRRKLETDPTRPRYLLTETGVGYRFRLSD